MKHVIVIETVGILPTDDEQRQEFQDEVVRACEAFTYMHVGVCFVLSRFFQESAIDAVLEMFGTSRKEIAAAEAQNAVTERE
jgi:hypothetical protein